MAETRYQRFERRAVIAIPGGRERPHGAAVEAPHGCHDLRPARGQTAEFDRRLDRLSAGIAEEGPIHTAWRHARQGGQEFRPLIVVEDLRAGDQAPGLPAEGLHDPGMRVAQVGGPLSADAVDIRSTVCIPDACPWPRTMASGRLG